jgi:hypothetical protein
MAFAALQASLGRNTLMEVQGEEETETEESSDELIEVDRD